MPEPKTSRKKTTKLEDFFYPTSDFKMHCQLTVIKTGWCWHGWVHTSVDLNKGHKRDLPMEDFYRGAEVVQ
jgi:hypothetical protein